MNTTPHTERRASGGKEGHMAFATIVPTTTHHSAVTVEQSEALMALRPEYVEAGRPTDHEYALSIANIEWDAPAAMVRIAGTDSYAVFTIDERRHESRVS